MNIMYQFDNNFAYIAGTSILSLLENNKDVDEINFYIITDSVSTENRNKIREIIDSYGRILIFIEKPNMIELLGREVRLYGWIDNIFSKILLGEVFKNYSDIQRMIYIDSDTLILGSLKELWELKLGGHVGAAVCEAMGNLHKKAIGLSKTDSYFNSGVLLVDIEKWRRENLDKAVKKFIEWKKGKLEYPEECVLNGILSEDLIKLSPKYNITSLSIYFTSAELKRYRKSFINYSETERREALNDARIIHFTSTYVDNRPWMEACQHPYANRWIAYKAGTPWKDEPLRKEQRKRMNKIVRQVALKIPRVLRIELTGFIHAYIKPLRFLW